MTCAMCGIEVINIYLMHFTFYILHRRIRSTLNINFLIIQHINNVNINNDDNDDNVVRKC